MRRIIFFIDGFNVYHALNDNLQYHKYKWLDFSKLAKCYVTKQDVIADIFYFTAYADWDPPKRARHQILIQALRLKKINIIFGKFKYRDKKCRLCHGIYQIPEEKQTDVNIAIKLFQAAIRDDFDTAIIISGDGDLIPAIKAVKETFPQKKIGLVIPIGRHTEELKNVCDFHMKMKEKHLFNSQFPEEIIIDPVKKISLKPPSSWI
jgi:uncharacterized LabA/DUF88 family protein